jgi:hypothetical protein
VGAVLSPPRPHGEGPGVGLPLSPQFFFVKSAMLAGVTNWNGM